MSIRSSIFLGLIPALMLSVLLFQGCSASSDTTAGAGNAGEVVYRGQTARIRGFDPAKAGDVASALAIAKISEGLVQYSYLARPYRVEPALAESLPEVSADGLTYTFKIRKGIYFQDDPCFTNTPAQAGGPGKGRELTAEDFVYSIKRIADVKTESTGFWVFGDRVIGLDEFRAASAKSAVTDYAAPVEGLSAVDRYTLRFKLKMPYPQLLWVLTMHYASAVPREAVEYYGAEYVNHPVGTGPYVLKSKFCRSNYRYEFERNPKWKETGRVELYPSDGEPSDRERGLLNDAGRQMPFIDRIILWVVDDASTQWLKFVQGEFEISGVSRDNFNAVVTKEKGLTEELRKMGISMSSVPTLDVYYLGFNMDDPVVGGNPTAGADKDKIARNRKLRQAMTCAFNSEEWIKFYNGRVMRAKGPVPPGVAGYEEKPSPYPFDLARGKRLLAEAGYPDGIDPATGKRLRVTVEIGNAADPEVKQSVELLVKFMDKLGIVLVPSYNNWPTFLAKMERRQCQMFELGWVADYPDAENFLQLFYGPNSSPNPNHCNYVNPEFDALYEKVRVMSDTPERTQLYKKMAEIVIEDCPWIFMHNPMSYGLQHEWLGNYKPHDFPYGMDKYRKLDTGLRARRLAEFRTGKVKE